MAPRHHPDAAATPAKAPLTTTTLERRQEWYLLGTNKKNAKSIVLSRHVQAPAPQPDPACGYATKRSRRSRRRSRRRSLSGSR